MAKYRRKPIIVEAEQWFPGKEVAGVSKELILPSFKLTGNYCVMTIHKQKVILEPGDYILPEPDGIHYYPVKPDIFESTYEKVED